MHRKKASQSGSGAPISVTPEFIGQIYYDTTNEAAYAAYGTSVGEWYELSLNIPGGGGTGLRLIVDYTVSGAAVDEIEFTNLDINTHQTYIIIAKLLNPTNERNWMKMYVNGDGNENNYTSSNGKSSIFRVDKGNTLAVIYLNRYEDGSSGASINYVRKEDRSSRISGWFHDVLTDINITEVLFSYENTTNVMGVDSNISIFGVA